MASEGFKQLVRHALAKRDQLVLKRDQLREMEKQCQTLREEVGAFSQAFRIALGSVMEEAQHRYKNDRLIEIDGLYYLIRVNGPHMTEDSIVVLEPEMLKEKSNG